LPGLAGVPTWTVTVALPLPPLPSATGTARLVTTAVDWLACRAAIAQPTPPSATPRAAARLAARVLMVLLCWLWASTTTSSSVRIMMMVTVTIIA
jgi:hypothetical protein